MALVAEGKVDLGVGTDLSSTLITIQGRLQDMEELTNRLQGELANTASSAAAASNKLMENVGIGLLLCFLFLVVGVLPQCFLS